MTASSRGPRERMVWSAAQLIRQRGVTGTGVRDVVEHAQAPRGSVQHYFPGGKQQLVDEAVAWAGRYAGSRIEKFLAGMARPTPGRLFAAMAGQWIEEFSTLGFGAGCPLAATTADCADTSEPTRQAVAAAFERWRAPLADALGGMGVPTRRARPLATLMLSTLEGAIILARAERDVAPLRTVVRELGPFLDGQLPAR